MKLQPEGGKRLRDLARREGIETDKALAEAMEINESQFHRVMSGECRPGERFLAGALLVVGPIWFTAIFDAETDEDAAA